MPKSNHYRNGIKRKRTKCQFDGRAGVVGKICDQCGRKLSK